MFDSYFVSFWTTIGVGTSGGIDRFVWNLQIFFVQGDFKGLLMFLEKEGFCVFSSREAIYAIGDSYRNYR